MYHTGILRNTIYVPEGQEQRPLAGTTESLSRLNLPKPRMPSWTQSVDLSISLFMMSVNRGFEGRTQGFNFQAVAGEEADRSEAIAWLVKLFKKKFTETLTGGGRSSEGGGGGAPPAEPLAP